MSEIKNIDTKEIKLGKPMHKKSAEGFVRLLSPTKNINDGRVVEIPVNKIGNIIHSVAVSETSVYKNSESLGRFRVIDPGVRNSSPFIDIRLKEFFDFVN